MATFTILARVSAWNCDTHSKEYFNEDLLGVFTDFEEAKKTLRRLSEEFFTSEMITALADLPEEDKKELKEHPEIGYGSLPEYHQKCEEQQAHAYVVFYKKDDRDLIYSKDFEVKEILTTF